MISKIVKRIAAENIPIKEVDELDGERRPEYLYALVNYSYITVPRLSSVSQLNETFTLAHELGHFYQSKRRGNFISSFFKIARVLSKKGHLVPKFIVIWDEADAWMRAYRICKEEGFATQGFISQAASSIWSYCRDVYRSFFVMLRYMVSLYLAAFFFVRFVSLHPIYRVELGLTGNFQSDFMYVGSLYSFFITLLVIVMCLRLLWNWIMIPSNTYEELQPWSERQKRRD